MIKLPNGQWNINQKSDLYGSISATRNLDFNKAGYIAPAGKVNTLSSSTSTFNYGLPIATTSDNTYDYVAHLQGFAVYNFANASYLSTNFASGASVPFFDLYSDSVMYLGITHVIGQVSGAVGVHSYSGGTLGTWTPRITTGYTTNVPHPLCVMENRQTLLVGNGNVLNQYSSAYALDTTNQLTLPSDYLITWIRYRQSTAVIGTRNINGGEAKVFFWNGTGTGFQTAYGVGADWAYSGIEYQSSIAVIVSSGRLLRFTGAGFEEIASLPVWSSPYSWASTAASNSLIGKVANRGMAVHGDLLYINLDGSLNVGTYENPGLYLDGQPGGLWVYDPSVGLSHKSGYATDPMLFLTPVSVNSGNLVFAVPHQAQTGDGIEYAFTGALGLNVGQTYYAVVDGPTAVALALSPADAQAGRKIALSATPTTDSFYLQTHTQQGTALITTPGLVSVLGIPHLNTFIATEVLFSGIAKDATLTDQNLLMSLGMSRNTGSLVTPKLQSAAIEDTLQKLYTKFDSLDLDTDKILVKFRKQEKFGLPNRLSLITWVTPTSFTINTTTQDFKSVSIGNEIDIIAGAVAGYTAHITAIDSSTTTYTVTIDESLPITATNTSMIVCNNWFKKDTLTNLTKNTSDGFGEIGVDKTGTWAQAKIEMRGNVLMNQVIFGNSVHKQP